MKATRSISSGVMLRISGLIKTRRRRNPRRRLSLKRMIKRLPRRMRRRTLRKKDLYRIRSRRTNPSQRRPRSPNLQLSSQKRRRKRRQPRLKLLKRSSVAISMNLNLKLRESPLSLILNTSQILKRSRIMLKKEASIGLRLVRRQRR